MVVSSGDFYSHMGVALAGAKSLGKLATFVGDIVKICTRGRIYVEIPKRYNSCCPQGDEAVTSIIAHLVAVSTASGLFPCSDSRSCSSEKDQEFALLHYKN